MAFALIDMTYDLKSVFYLGADHEYTNADYNAVNDQGAFGIDVSSYVDPISKGKRRGQGLAVYKVHSRIAADANGGNVIATATGSIAYALTVKPFSSDADGTTGLLTTNDLTPASDLNIYCAQYVCPASGAPGMTSGEIEKSLEPSKEVPYVVVRDTIFGIVQSDVALGQDLHVTYRMECAMITLDTATLNQLLRTQTA
jgi:hypothetical protein